MSSDTSQNEVHSNYHTVEFHIGTTENGFTSVGNFTMSREKTGLGTTKASCPVFIHVVGCLQFNLPKYKASVYEFLSSFCVNHIPSHASNPESFGVNNYDESQT